ncbi:protein-methionine-sulfoxide reductase catalytic subunit MsrP [Desertibaculum subflavum]|uniref:protein-methionine-sulfoxide reductase catalytic subunit MsrP n=1 Tax=Desertibaculum subflavum TaxID=2268458 RepID=UPI000E6695C3
MLIKRPKGWELPERAATPEAIYHGRRTFLAGLPAMLLATQLPGIARAADADPSAALYPVKPNPKYGLDRPITPEKLATTYNNFYEFGSHKEIWREAQDRLKLRPWTVKLDGMVEKPIEIGFDDLLKQMPLEERLYRHRCVEAWSMAVPWSGFPLAALVAFAKPLGGAKYVEMKTFMDVKMAPAQRQSWYPWPYTEGLTIEEATNELAFIATGLYGKPIPAQSGAPLRLAVPWKYGFKSVKSIVSFSFTDKRPKTFWEEIQGREYGFWANVNPEVPHPRWSQATERVLGAMERVPTQIYNGYGEYVAGLYADKKGEKLFM